MFSNLQNDDDDFLTEDFTDKSPSTVPTTNITPTIATARPLLKRPSPPQLLNPLPKKPVSFENATKTATISKPRSAIIPEVGSTCRNSPFITKRIRPSLSQLSTQIPLDSGPWDTMLTDLKIKELDIAQFSVANILSKADLKQLPNSKATILLIVVKRILGKENKSTSVAFKDKTGEISGTINWGSMIELQDKLQKGTALVLRNVSVFTIASVCDKKHYVNITTNNLVGFYTYDSRDNLIPNQNLDTKVREWIKANTTSPKQIASTCLQSPMNPIVQSSSSSPGKRVEDDNESLWPDDDAELDALIANLSEEQLINQ